MKWTHNFRRLSIQFIAKYASMVNDMTKICPKVMYMLCSHSKSALLTCTVTPYLLCFICIDCTLFTVNVLLLQCSFVYKMHPKEKTCSRSSINTTAQPKNTHFKSHVCISTSDIPCTITGILHITVSTSLSHIPPIACKCFFSD